MSWMRFETTIALFERAKKFHALDRTATVSAFSRLIFRNPVTGQSTETRVLNRIAFELLRAYKQFFNYGTNVLVSVYMRLI
jgi:hypothetical protein